MNRNRHQTVSAILPANTTTGNAVGYFTKGDSTLGIPPTVPTADWANGITEELINALNVAGLTPSENNLAQLANAIGIIGRRKNLIINGDFDIWQRGAGAFTANGFYADRFYGSRTTTTHSVTQQAFTIGQTEVPNNPVNFLQNVITSASGAGSFSRLQQKIADVRRTQGKTLTVSFWAKADVAKNIAVEFVQNFGTGGSPSADVTTQGVAKFALTTSWAKYTATVTLASISGMTLGSNNDDGLILNMWMNAGSTYNSRTNTIGLLSATVSIAQIQVEEGSQATGFEILRISEKWALCKRYYSTVKAYVGTAATNIFFDSMRAAPTVAGGGAGFALDDAGLGNSIVCHQTTGAVQTLTFDADI